jgi:peptide/nickel transport system substrate-binding protein
MDVSRRVHDLILAACVAATVACGSREPAPAPAADARTLRIVGPWEITSIDPLRAGYLFSRMEVVETLVDASDDGTLRPGLATSWTVSDDGRTWQFHLPSGVEFHDGSPLTAAAVVSALERARTEPGALAGAPITALQAGGDVVIVSLTAPFALLPALLSHSSTQILAPASFDGGVVRRVIGTGPYRITSLEPPQRFSVARFDKWRGTPPAVASASFLSVARAESRALLTESGQADLSFGLDPPSLARLRSHPTVRIVAVTIPRTIVLKLNAGHPALRDRRVREAFSLALDRQGIARALLRDPEMAATQLLPPSLAAWHADDLAPLTMDLDRARTLLAEAGWQRDGRGWRDATGQPVRLTLRTFPDRPELPVMATAVQEQLRQLGVDVGIEVGNSSDVPAGHRDGSLELALAARNYGNFPDPVATLLQDFGPEGGDWGGMGWSDAAVVDALRVLASQPARADGPALRHEVVATLQRDLPIIPVAWYRQTVAVNPRVSGVTLDPLERSYRVSEMSWTQGSASPR